MKNDTDNRIFEVDVTLSAEIFGDGMGPQTPERSLMIAVLEDAARCLLRSCTATVDRKLRALYDETREWFSSDSTTELYDFENVCAVLGINADWLRGRLFGLVDRQRAAAAGAPPTTDGREADDVVLAPELATA
jgi:hypothetical protein